MKSVNFLIVIAVVSLFLNACEKDVDPKCHFTEEQKKQALYYSYKTGDTLCLLKNGIDTINLVVNSARFIEYLPPLGTRPPCDETIYIYFKPYSKVEIFAQVYKCNDFFVNINFFGEKLIRKDTSDTILEEFIVNNVIYNNVYIYTSSSFNSKIYANQEFGILKAEIDTVSYTLIP